MEKTTIFMSDRDIEHAAACSTRTFGIRLTVICAALFACALSCKDQTATQDNGIDPMSSFLIAGLGGVGLIRKGNRDMKKARSNEVPLSTLTR